MKWLFQNIRRRAAFAVQNPRYAAASMLRELTRADETFLARITNSSKSQIAAYLNEPILTPAFAAHLRAAEAEFDTLSITSADLYAKKILCQYAAVRAFKPEVILETGIANGVSSAYLLLAVQKNRRGHLYSVGLNDPNFLPPGKTVGWFVPDWLQAPWRIRLGDTRELLPALLKELQHIDIFIHDSLHTYDHMLWKFTAAYTYVASGGLLFADDALWNSAFADFAQQSGAREAQILHGVGFLRKH